jgi:hypothetical protein
MGIVNMMEIEYLINSRAIRDKIHQIFSNKNDKIAIVGFVGINANEYIPKRTRNLRIICWPKPGATHPDGVRSLLRHNIRVDFCNNLHIKIYWTKGVGLIITSANLSDNAFNENRLIEYGVFIKDKLFDIYKLIKTLKTFEINQLSMDKLEKGTNQFNIRNTSVSEKSIKINRFIDYYREPFLKKWKVIFWSKEFNSKTLKGLKNSLENEYGIDTHYRVNQISKEDNYIETDICLQIKINENKTISRSAKYYNWLLIEYIVKSGHTKAAFQKRRISDSSFPFKIDYKFTKAFSDIYNIDKDNMLTNNYYLKKSSLNKIYNKLLDQDNTKGNKTPRQRQKQSAQAYSSQQSNGAPLRSGLRQMPLD